MVNERDTQYLLLTPGPLSTTRTVRSAMMQEYSTWDVDYNSIVEFIRVRLVRLGGSRRCQSRRSHLRAYAGQRDILGRVGDRFGGSR